MSPSQKMGNLYDSIDTSGSGSITQAQFQQAFATQSPPASFQAQGSTSVWNDINPNGSATVSKDEFVSGMTALMKAHRGHSHGGVESATGAQTLADSASALDVLTGSGATGSGTTFQALA